MDGAEKRIRDEAGRFLTGHPGSLKRYRNREDLLVDVVKYFAVCGDDVKPPTMTGLALALGFRSRFSLVNYSKEEGFEFAFDVIAFARMKLEEFNEERLHDPRNFNVAGLIFSMKNNFGWQDRQDIRIDQRTLQLDGFTMHRNDGEESKHISE